MQASALHSGWPLLFLAFLLLGSLCRLLLWWRLGRLRGGRRRALWRTIGRWRRLRLRRGLVTLRFGPVVRLSCRRAIRRIGLRPVVRLCCWRTVRLIWFRPIVRLCRRRTIGLIRLWTVVRLGGGGTVRLIWFGPIVRLCRRWAIWLIRRRRTRPLVRNWLISRTIRRLVCRRSRRGLCWPGGIRLVCGLVQRMTCRWGRWFAGGRNLHRGMH